MFLRGKKRLPRPFPGFLRIVTLRRRQFSFFSKIINKVSTRWPKNQKTLSTRLFSSLKLKLNIKRGFLARTKTRFDMASFKETISEWIFIVRHSCTQVLLLTAGLCEYIYLWLRLIPSKWDFSALFSDRGEFETALFLLRLRNHCIRQFFTEQGACALFRWLATRSPKVTWYKNVSNLTKSQASTLKEQIFNLIIYFHLLWELFR